MGIEKIEIENYKSIKKCEITFKELNLIIGENGCGKTNTLSAIDYFYKAMIGKEIEDEDIYDKNNKFANEIKIAITYDCTELRKIIVRKIRSSNLENYQYYERIINLIGKKNKIYLELKKIKNMPIKWNIDNYTDREIIYNNFPLYFIDAKKINFKSWQFIWEDIGDLLKLEKNIEEQLKTQLLDNIGENTNIVSKLKTLEDMLNESEIQVKNYTPKQYASMIAKLYFKGGHFQVSQYEPNYFSDGTNAFNYIKILLDIVSIIKKNKIKFPIIIIDEPEISLHHKYIDKLYDKIIENNSQYILATHSARMLKNILKYGKENSNIIHFKYKNKYTTCSQVKLFEDERQNSVINDEHVNSYFSSMILLVEGESELQLFNNEYLREIYPVLKNIDIVKAVADNVVKEGILPNKRNYNVNYLLLIDIDKILISNTLQNKFTINKKEKYFSKYEKEKYYYGEKRNKTYKLKKQILNMIDKCRFHYLLPFYSCTDKNYYTLIKYIKEYFIQYNIFVNSTTLEGLLINEENKDKFWQYYLIRATPSNDFKDSYNNYNSTEQTNLLRLLVEGKTDYILNLKQLDKANANLKDMITKNNLSKKTAGWISDWIIYYLCDILNIQKTNNIEIELKKQLKKEQNKEKCKNFLQNDFRELSNIIKELTKRYNSNSY